MPLSKSQIANNIKGCPSILKRATLKQWMQSEGSPRDYSLSFKKVKKKPTPYHQAIPVCSRTPKDGAGRKNSVASSLYNAFTVQRIDGGIYVLGEK